MHWSNMCSINGFNFRDEGLIRKMVEETKHRGPDQDGFYCDENVSLGHARLSIIDLSEKGRQPIWNEDKTICVIANGEIYNFQELRRDLEKKGHRFFSKSDSEVIVHLWEEKQEKCAEELNGIFAFAIYEKNTGKLFLARDRIGVKPLYYYFDNNNFIFSSEIKGILAHNIKREIDERALNYHFRFFFTPAPFTLLRRIYKLMPSQALIFEKGEIKIRKYWDIKGNLPEIESADEAMEGIRFWLKDSIRRQLISDRPLGIFLSGGIDSTSVLGIASEMTKAKIKTYSVGFDIDIETEKYNLDFELARKTSQHYNTDHHELLISGADAREHLEKVIIHMEEPAPNPVQIPTYLLAQMAKKSVAVVLGGDGGDEIFGGYDRYLHSRTIDRFQSLPGILKHKLLPLFLEKVLRKSDLKTKLNTGQGIARYLLFMAQNKKVLSKAFKKELPKKHALEEFLKEYYPENKFKDNNKYLMYLDLLTWLSDESLLRSDKMTMAHGLEQRVPILDHALVEFAFRIPTAFKVRNKKNNKWIFREAMKEYLPQHLLNKSKRGWFSPASKWLRKELRTMAYEILSPGYSMATRDYFDFNQARAILDKHISGEEYNLDIIWSLLTFQIWYRKFINNQ